MVFFINTLNFHFFVVVEYVLSRVFINVSTVGITFHAFMFSRFKLYFGVWF